MRFRHRAAASSHASEATAPMSRAAKSSSANSSAVTRVPSDFQRCATRGRVRAPRRRPASHALARAARRRRVDASGLPTADGWHGRIPRSRAVPAPMRRAARRRRSCRWQRQSRRAACAPCATMRRAASCASADSSHQPWLAPSAVDDAAIGQRDDARRVPHRRCSCVTMTTVWPSRTSSANSVEQALRRVRIEVAGRLVGEQDRRRVGQRARHGDALLLSARQRARELVGLIGDAEPVEQVRARARGVRAPASACRNPSAASRSRPRSASAAAERTGTRCRPHGRATPTARFPTMRAAPCHR